MANQFSNLNVWTPERVEKLISLVKHGCSGGFIAAQLGLTRNSVIGKVHRLGMQLGNSRNSMRQQLAAQLRLKANYRRKKSDRLRPPPPKVVFAVEPLPAPDVADVPRKTLAQLEINDCRFPVGDPKDAGFGFCALECVPGSSYCATHKARTSAGVPVRTRITHFTAKETVGF
jgi:GcrA cell cycle regulator